MIGVLSKGFNSLVDFFFPPTCVVCEERLSPSEQIICLHCRSQLRWLQAPFCPFCGKEWKKKVVKRCPACPKPEAYFDFARSALQYNDVSAELIHRLKYQGHFSVAKLMAYYLLIVYHSEFERVPIDYLIPAPLHPARFRQRGYNQTELVAQEVAKYTNLSVRTDLLLKCRPTASQTQLTPEDRLTNLQGAFEVANPEEIKGKNVLILDDVMTTGATVNECAQALKQADAGEVFVLTFARS